MNYPGFPDFVRRLPQADLPFSGLRGFILQGPASQLLFLEADIEVFVPEHSHGDQWGFVVEGSVDLAFGDRSETFNRGDSYFIPAGTSHKALIHAGFRAVDYFADRNRYRPLPPEE